MAADWPYLGLHDGAGNQLLALTQDPDTDPFFVDSFDPGAIDVVEDVSPDPAGDGTVDNTAHTGASAVTVELTLLGSDTEGPQVWGDRLRALMHPSQRPYIHAQALDWPAPRRLLVRGASAPRDLTDPEPTYQFQWKAPLGYFEDVDVTEASLMPVAVSVRGLTAPVAAPVFTPPTNPDGGAPVIVGGLISPWWELDVYGPCVAPALTSAAGWQVAATSGLTIATGHFTRFTPNSAFGPAVLGDGDPEQDEYGFLDFGATSWRPLAVGPNHLTLTAASFGAGFRAVLRWRNRWP